MMRLPPDQLAHQRIMQPHMLRDSGLRVTVSQGSLHDGLIALPPVSHTLVRQEPFQRRPPKEALVSPHFDEPSAGTPHSADERLVAQNDLGLEFLPRAGRLHERR